MDRMDERLVRVEQHIIRRDDPRFAVLDQACFFGKNIYNAANYQRRQQFIHHRQCMTYEAQEKGFKKRHLLPDQQLPMKVVQQVLKLLHNDWQSFLAASAEYKTQPAKFTGQPRLPRYKDKANGRCTLTFTEQAISQSALAQGSVVL